VVDVHVRIAAPALGDEVHQPLEARPLLGAVVCPDAVVTRLAVLKVDPAEEVLEAAGGLEPGIAFEVQPDVAVRGSGHSGEAAFGLDRQRVDAVLVGAVSMELELRLVAEFLEGLRAEPLDARLGWGVAERGQGDDLGCGELFNLGAGNSRDPWRPAIPICFAGVAVFTFPGPARPLFDRAEPRTSRAAL